MTTSDSSHAAALPPLHGAAPAPWLDSAVSASTYSVPAGFLWASDLVVLLSGLAAARILAPILQPILAAQRASSTLSWLSVPPATTVTRLGSPAEMALIFLVMVPVTLMATHMLGGYRPLLAQSRTRVALASLVPPLFGLSVVTLVLLTVRNTAMPRSLLYSATLLASAGLFTSRYAIRFYKYRRLLAGHYARNIVVLAPASVREWMVEHFTRQVSAHFHRLYGYLELPDETQAAATSIQGVLDSAAPLARLGDVGALGELLVHKPIHEVIVVQSAGSESWLRGVIEQCEYFQVVVRLVPEALLSWQSRASDALVIDTGPLRLPEIVIRARHFDERALFVKRLFDILVSGALLFLLFPVFLMIAIAIKLTTPRLPVFYPWRVIGYKGRAFTGYKFTTMVADAEARQAHLLHLNEMSGPVFKINKDPRITPFGRILRKFSLNELPQLWSVLRGDMSLVGPRPAYPNELARYELWHKRKLCVQPGITCLWQVSGRNRIASFDDWVRMDFEYIDNWSLWLDCRILLRTAWAVVAGTGS